MHQICEPLFLLIGVPARYPEILLHRDPFAAVIQLPRQVFSYVSHMPWLIYIPGDILLSFRISDYEAVLVTVRSDSFALCGTGE